MLLTLCVTFLSIAVVSSILFTIVSYRTGQEISRRREVERRAQSHA